MLNLSGVVKKTDFDFEDVDGIRHHLTVSEYTVGDMKKLIDIQAPLLEQEKISIGARSEIIVASRIICAVKVKPSMGYFWLTIDEIVGKDYPNDLINTLYEMVGEMNPVKSDATVDEKKN